MLLLAALALAETDELGGYDSTNNNGDMMKLIVVDVEETAVVTNLQFYLETGRGTGGVSLVVYQQDGGDYSLLGNVEVSDLPDNGDGFADSGTVSWLLEAGQTYAIGAWLEGDWGYAYTEGESADPWFGAVVGGLRVESDGVTDSFEDPGLEDYLYAMVVESQPADADGDGAVALSLGGDDCDDADPMTLPGAAEVAYDGVDQDCDGADLADVDGDGADAEEVGGEDCDDTDPAFGPGVKDICGDGIDQNCSGSDSLCSGGEGIDASPGCGCDAGAGSAGAAALGLAALVLARRRR